MTSDGRLNETIRVRVSLGLVGVNLSMAAVTGLWFILRRRTWSRPCGRVLAIGAPLVFVALALVEVTVPLYVVEPDRVRRNHRLANREVPIDGLDDLRLGKRTLRRRSDGYLIETTLGARKSDLEHLRHSLDHVDTPDALPPPG